MPSMLGPRLVLGCLAAALPIVGAPAQCDPTWAATGGLFGVSGAVKCMTPWDPDGPGPGATVLVLGGGFDAAGPVAARNVAVWDPVLDTLRPLGAGMDHEVLALASTPQGDLFAAGDFRTADGRAANRVARWDGSAWQPLGSGANSIVFDLAILPNGDLLAAGWFTTMGGVPVPQLARWNGASWSAMPPGNALVPDCVLQTSGGDLIVGGGVTVHGSSVSTGVERFDGALWTPLGGGFGGLIYDLAELPNGDVVAAGDFGTVGGTFYGNVARFDGTSWQPLGLGLAGVVLSLAALPNGDLIAGGLFTTAGGAPAAHVARWNGGTWSPLGSGVDQRVYAVGALGADVAVGGLFHAAGGARADGVAVWDGAVWDTIGPVPDAFGVVGVVARTVPAPGGGLIVAGSLIHAGTVPVHGVARWDGFAWSDLGGGAALQGSPSGLLFDAVRLSDGDVVVAGAFDHMSGVAAANIARWDGVQWHPLGSGLNANCLALAVGPADEVYAVGFFTTAGGVAASRVARWDGAGWSALGGGFDATARRLLLLPNGDLIVGGDFAVAGGIAVQRVARWDGQAWGPFGALTAPTVFARTAAGDLLAGEAFTGGSTAVRRWDGATWAPLATGLSSTGPITGGEVAAIHELPDGDLLVAGKFGRAGTVLANHIARWDGTTWQAVDTGVGVPSLFDQASSIQALPDGRILVGGSFAQAGAHVVSSLALLESGCPAQAASEGGACQGAAGPVDLVATSLPWLGGTFATRTTGLPANAFAIAIRGTAQLAVPLAGVLPFGLPGCLQQTDVLQSTLHAPQAGSFELAVPVPEDPALLGFRFYEQSLVVELDAQARVQGVAASNRLALVVGRF
ncbi:MAG: hypothetical protein AB7O97_00600 [Planctomycetota bacterium]